MRNRVIEIVYRPRLVPCRSLSRAVTLLGIERALSSWLQIRRSKDHTYRAGVLVQLGVIVDVEEVGLASADRLRRRVVTRSRHRAR